MRFSILITASPFTHQASDTAFHFAQAVLAKGHQISQIFFYQDSVHNGSRLACSPQDEMNLTECWQQLAKQHGIELTLCATAALRRGILDSEEAKRYEKGTDNIASTFQLSGLGQLIIAATESDRFIQFGN